MSKMKFAIAMLAPSGVPTADASKRTAFGAFAAATAGSMMLVPAAHAGTELAGSLVNPYFHGYSETFDVETTGYVDQGTLGVYDFTLTSDSAGNNSLFFADANLEGKFGTGTNSGAGVTPYKLDFSLSGTPYTGSSFTLTPGVYHGYFGTVLTLGIPEPDAWALLIAGAAMAGGAVRIARRRRQSAAMA